MLLSLEVDTGKLMKAADAGKDGKSSQVPIIFYWLVVRVNDGMLNVLDEIVSTLFAVLPVIYLGFEFLDAVAQSDIILDVEFLDVNKCHFFSHKAN